ncbi:MAG: hypothetical protein H7836_09105 [Magnetococcus sp. YQC-3]
MKPETILATMAANGIHLYVSDAGELRHRGKRGQMTGEFRAMLTEHREALSEWLQADPGGRPLTDEEKRRVEEAFNSLRDQHGHALVAAGWHRDVVFDGLDPTRCETAGDVPGVIGLLMAGGRLVKIHPDRLDLEFPDGELFSKIRGGCFLGGKVLEDYLITGK